MDVPRVVILGATPVASAAFAFALAADPALARHLMIAGFGLSLVLGAYAVLRLRGDLAAPLSGVALAQGLVFHGLFVRCAGRTCGALEPVWTAFHVGAFGGAMASLTILVASSFAKELRGGLLRGATTVLLAGLALALLFAGWTARARALAA